MNNCTMPCRSAQMYTGSREARQSDCSACRESSDTSCACTKGRFPVNTAYAMAYVPFQQSGEVYACDRALTRGTIFPCLDLPFLKGCCK